MVQIRTKKKSVGGFRPRRIVLTPDEGCRLLIDQESEGRIVIYEVAKTATLEDAREMMERGT